jgi:hypothetical protein
MEDHGVLGELLNPVLDFSRWLGGDNPFAIILAVALIGLALAGAYYGVRWLLDRV